jgi:hypothetical protein
MAQTPYRDFIKTAVVDFRFYNGTLRNYANNTYALTFANPTPNFVKSNGVKALAYIADSASQTWMTSLSTTEVTIEFLACPDMFHNPAGESSASTFRLIEGDWNIGFANHAGTESAFNTKLWASFNTTSYSETDYIVSQELAGSDSTTSLFKGSPIHVILSAKWIDATSLEITTYVNGVWDNVTSTTFASDFMDTTPTNTWFSDYTEYAACPVYFLRMWNSYTEDAQLFADMFANAKRILPNVEFPVPASGALAFYVPS